MTAFIITSGIFAIAILLTLIGSVLKYRTGTSNELIALILTGISILVWSLIGVWKSIGGSDNGFLFSVLWEHGISYGIPTAAFAIWGWDLFHGAHRFRKDRRQRKDKESQNKQEEGSI